jgi:iron complex transport system ATP-binding protein
VVTRLAARGVGLEYPGPIRALAGVDFELAAGELVAVIGPNGAGKSSLLRVLAGLEPHGVTGEVLLAGRPLASYRARERARALAVVPQTLRALPEVTVETFVTGGRYAYLGPFGHPRPEDRAAVLRALEEADVADLRARLLTDLSGGQRQRVLVARALAQQADVLLFDEPTAALDPEHQVGVLALLSQLVDGGRAAVFATHDLVLAGRHAHRILLLADGRVHAVGAPREVLRREVLEPLFGGCLHYATGPDGAAGGVPLVVPWPAAD